jgi:hypothetical protein
VPDLLVQHVDGLLAERTGALARQRQCSVHDGLVAALHTGLGLSSGPHCREILHDPRSLRVLDGHWEAAERGAFQAALQALADTRPTRLAPGRKRYGEPGPGAE